MLSCASLVISRDFWKTPTMNDLRELLKLSVEEKIQLIGELWDSIDAQSHPPLTDAEKAELDKRLDDLEANPDNVRSWSQVRADLLSCRK
jgi:putative addiction module component (TIGR02574 family)